MCGPSAVQSGQRVREGNGALVTADLARDPGPRCACPSCPSARRRDCNVLVTTATVTRVGSARPDDACQAPSDENETPVSAPRIRHPEISWSQKGTEGPA